MLEQSIDSSSGREVLRETALILESFICRLERLGVDPVEAHRIVFDVFEIGSMFTHR